MKIIFNVFLLLYILLNGILISPLISNEFASGSQIESELKNLFSNYGLVYNYTDRYILISIAIGVILSTLSVVAMFFRVRY